MQEILERFDRLDSRLDRIDPRFDQVDARLDKVDARLTQVDTRIDQLDTRMNQRFDRLEIAILDLAGRVVAKREVEEIKAKMSSGAAKGSR